ncbi:MAG: SDR family oxidoreductase [Flavobacteriales bacterium]|nr:SDR family oxidoreductase [Flavobacteriales bacterium]
MIRKKVLVTGSNGLLGQKIIYSLIERKDIDLLASSKGLNRLITKSGYKYIDLDITKNDEVKKVFENETPDAVINCAAMTNVDYCEENQDSCWEINVNAAENLAKSCEVSKSHLLHLSTDFVFDGKSGPYTENDKPNPLHFYAKSKLKSEEIVKKIMTNWTIARTIIIYGITDNMSRSNIVLWAKSEIGKGNTINVVNDQYRSPTLAEDLAKGCISIIDKSAYGLYHLSGPKTYSILDLVYQVADFYNLDKSLILPVTSASLNQSATRPLSTGFDITKAKKDLDFNPVDFLEGIKIMDQQIKNHEI